MRIGTTFATRCGNGTGPSGVLVGHALDGAAQPTGRQHSSGRITLGAVRLRTRDVR